MDVIKFIDNNAYTKKSCSEMYTSDVVPLSIADESQALIYFLY